MRYWIPTIKHHYAFELGSKIENQLVDIIYLIEEASNELNKGDHLNFSKLAIGIILGSCEVLTCNVPGGDPEPIFYPVNKLVGFKISNVLKRCGVVALIYPYPSEPDDDLLTKAGIQDLFFRQGQVRNVSGKGLKKLAAKEADHLIHQQDMDLNPDFVQIINNHYESQPSNKARMIKELARDQVLSNAIQEAPVYKQNNDIANLIDNFTVQREEEEQQQQQLEQQQ